MFIIIFFFFKNFNKIYSFLNKKSINKTISILNFNGPEKYRPKKNNFFFKLRKKTQTNFTYFNTFFFENFNNFLNYKNLDKKNNFNIKNLCNLIFIEYFMFFEHDVKIQSIIKIKKNPVQLYLEAFKFSIIGDNVLTGFDYFYKKKKFKKSFAKINFEDSVLDIIPILPKKFFFYYKSINVLKFNFLQCITLIMKSRIYMYIYNLVYIKKNFIFYIKKLIEIINATKNKNFVFYKNKSIKNINFILAFKKALSNLIFVNDIFSLDLNNSPILLNSFNKKNNLFSNISLVNCLNKFNDFNSIINKLKQNQKFNNKNELFFYNNHYPVFITSDISFKKILSKFKANMNIEYYNFIQLYVVNFFEFFFKKKVFLRLSTNFFKNHDSLYYLLKIFEDFKNYQPKYMKSFLIVDFLEIVWYTFFLKDLTLLSNWVTRLMESISFKNHKKFLLFFQNFIKKYAYVFIDILRIRGFFFDIRGKVGVTGNSKKRHIFFKIGKLKKSTKNSKMDFNQNLVRTPSGVLGLTYIVSY